MGQRASALGEGTTVALLDAYWRVHWASVSPGQRTKTRGRLLVMAASLVEPSDAARRVVDAADSDRFRTPVPIQSVHPFRSIPYTPGEEAA